MRAALCGAALATAVAGAAFSAQEPALRIEVRAYAVEGDNPLGAEETQALLAPFVGTHEGIAPLEAAADALERAIRARGRSLHRVVIPPQRPGDGVVRLRVLAFRVGAITVSGNVHYTRESVLRSLPALREGEPPDNAALARSLAVAGEHPRKQVSLVMRESGRPDAIDAEVRVRDAAPEQLFAALSNTGTSQTGRWRASAGYQHANLFDRDHVLTLSYTTAPEKVDDVRQYGVHYWAPLYAQGASVSAFYTRSDVDSGTVANFFQVSGRGEFYGVQYAQALPRGGAWTHKLAVGVEDRLFENGVSFLGTPIGVDVRSRPLSLRYQGRAEYEGGVLGGYVEAIVNLSGGSGNDDAAYRANRVGAARDWRAVRFGAEVVHDLGGGWQAVARLRGQLADEPLIPGEQFGVGGAASVRGMHERQTAGDRGYAASAEVWMPPLVPGLRAFGFVDAGRRSLHDPAPGQSGTDDVASVGVGLRWQWGRRLDVSADLARLVKGLDGGPAAGHGRLHFSLLYRF